MRHFAPWLLVVALASPVSAGVPSAANSTVPPLRGCPGADYANTIVVRDAAGVPVENAMVAIYLQCGAAWCIYGSWVDDYYLDWVSSRAIKYTDVSGTAVFHLRLTGPCFEPGSNVLVTADGVLLGNPSLASTDTDGDWTVDEQDYDLLLAAMPDPGLHGDFDADGMWDGDDAVAHATHLGHQCTIPLPAKPTTWGRVKQIYR